MGFPFVIFVKSLIKTTRGQSLAEYGLLLALIAIFCIGALIVLGDSISSSLNDVSQKLIVATPAPGGGGTGGGGGLGDDGDGATSGGDGGDGADGADGAAAGDGGGLGDGFGDGF